MSDGPVTPTNERFAEILGGLFHELMKAGGVMVPLKGFERIREVGRKCGATIEFHAERKAVEVARKLQAAIKDAFRAMERDVTNTREVVEKLERRVTELEQGQER